MAGLFLAGLAWYGVQSGPTRPAASRSARIVSPVQDTSMTLPRLSWHVCCLHESADGSLIADQTLRQFFDEHMRHAQGHAQQLEREVQADLYAQLNPAAAAKGLAIFHRYRAFQQALDLLEQGQSSSSLSSPDDLRMQLARVDQLRLQYLGAHLSQQLFPDVQPIHDLSAAELDVMQDHSLSQQQKIDRLQAMSQSLQAYAAQRDRSTQL